MGFNMQAKLLRVLQEREVERVGGIDSLKIDVRVVSATNQDLYEKVKDNTFREDLFYRINVIPILLPPLRKREGDLPLFIDYFLSKLNLKLGTSIIGITDEVMKIFELYSWPGNVRELENTLEGAMCLCVGEKIITTDHLPSNFVQRSFESGINVSTSSSSYLDVMIHDMEKEAITKALEKTQGNKKKAALLLGMPRSSFYNKLKQYNIT
jgi:transcriptional regulator with PAS, ATPase and Fis domain